MNGPIRIPCGIRTKRPDDGRWFPAYMDDASRFITGYGIFEHATGMNAIKVLHGATSKHGKPASILTDRRIQFYATESEQSQWDYLSLSRILSDRA